MENTEKNPTKNDKVAKMWHAENIRANLAKLSKLSSKCTPTQSPMRQTYTNQTESTFMDPIQSPRFKTPTTETSTTLLACPHCDKYRIMYKKQLKEKQNFQAKYMETQTKYEQLSQEMNALVKKLAHLSKVTQKATENIQPYKNNVVLMEQQLSQILKSINQKKMSENPSSETRRRMENELSQKKRTIDFQIHLLLKNHEREQENNEAKLARLNFVINFLENKSKQLENQNVELAHENKILSGIIHESSYVVQQRELFHMASEELYQMKMAYKTEKAERQKLTRFVQKLKNKIYMLTSLIGYGVVSNIQTNELQELSDLKQNIEKLNKIQQKLTADIFGSKSLKNYKSYQEVKQFADQQNYSNCLYQSNFLIMFDDEQIKNVLEENVAMIIKPEFFLLVRAIFDSKYSQFLIHDGKVGRFPEFAYSFIDCFKVKKNEKRIDLNSKRNNDEKDLMKNNFLLRIFDRKVGFLPEIATFREFLMKNTPQDQIFYYLMCRNLLFQGPELDIYLGSSDPYNFAPYEKVLGQVQQLLEGLDRNCRTIIFNHLNQKKIMKNKKLLIKTSYVIRLLLEVYRKIKKQKISRLKVIFEQTSKVSKSEHIKYSYFREILRKNFPSLPTSSIPEYYRKSTSIFESNAGTSFFDCFSVSCLESIFLEDNLEFSEEMKRKKSAEEEYERCNYLMELIPDSVSQLGNQAIYQQYVKFIKLKSLSIESRVKISQFLLKIVHSRLYSMPAKSREQEWLAESLDQVNNRLIDLINQNFKKRQRYQESLQKASSVIGKSFRKKIYQFYSQFVKDIKQQVSTHSNL